MLGYNMLLGDWHRGTTLAWVETQCTWHDDSVSTLACVVRAQCTWQDDSDSVSGGTDRNIMSLGVSGYYVYKKNTQYKQKRMVIYGNNVTVKVAWYLEYMILIYLFTAFALWILKRKKNGCGPKNENLLFA